VARTLRCSLRRVRTLWIPKNLGRRFLLITFGCATCGNLFNALTVPWCSCLAKEQTLLCSGLREVFLPGPAGLPPEILE